jgi:hypothetical protein
MDKDCQACGGKRFRLSRLRVSDLVRVLLLQYPVRCVGCRERSFASLFWVAGYRLRKRANRRR